MPLDNPLPTILREWLRTALLDVHVGTVAKIVKFDDAANTVDAQPVTKNRIPSQTEGTVAEDPVVIQDIPIVWPCSNNCYIKWPLQAGAHVMLVFNEHSIEGWRDTGQVSEPGDFSRHDLSYPVAIPGIRPDVGFPVAQIPTAGSAMVLEAPEIKLGEGATSLVALQSQLEALKAAITSAASTETSASGLGGMAALLAALATWPTVGGATKVSAE